jgi:hypothetical protein
MVTTVINRYGIHNKIKKGFKQENVRYDSAQNIYLPILYDTLTLEYMKF